MYPKTRKSTGRKAAYQTFLAAHPEYRATKELDKLRKKEYRRLDADKQVYLDYTGACLYPQSLVENHARRLKKQVFGNPHSSNPTSMLSTIDDIAARAKVLRFFDAPTGEYDVIWTANASAALKIVGEAYPFCPENRLVLSLDAHNSVNGMRKFAAGKGAEVRYVALDKETGLLDEQDLLDALSAGPENGMKGLFVMTGQSNSSGVKHPLSHLQLAQQHSYHTFLDAAALAPTTCISLRTLSVSAICVSFYKMFGYPTGIGALIVKKSFLQVLQRPWFGGGTIQLIQVPGLAMTYAEGKEAFEDGTINFLATAAVMDGLDFLSPYMGILRTRIDILTQWTVDQLATITHVNSNTRLVEYLGPKDASIRGSTIPLHFYTSSGLQIPLQFIELAANKHNISLRTGCVCNPGATSLITNSFDDLQSIESGMTKSDFTKIIKRPFPGIVRISFGIASNWKDAWAFVKFCKGLAGNPRLEDLVEAWDGPGSVASLNKVGQDSGTEV